MLTESQLEIDSAAAARERERAGCRRCRELAAAKQFVAPSGRVYRRCDACGQAIPKYTAMGGVGFSSHGVDHFHPTRLSVGGNKSVVVQDPVSLELCYHCYLEDFQREYPGEPLPIIANVEEVLGL